MYTSLFLAACIVNYIRQHQQTRVTEPIYNSLAVVNVF